jgi:hypothetical protein
MSRCYINFEIIDLMEENYATLEFHHYHLYILHLYQYQYIAHFTCNDWYGMCLCAVAMFATDEFHLIPYGLISFD